MRLGFTTDIHLDVLSHTKGFAQIQVVGRNMAADHDALVVAGDISQGPTLKNHLVAFCAGAAIPVYFVLGNHDFWDAPVAEVRAAAEKFSGYLDKAGVVELTPLTALVGRSGWYDTLSGNPFNSKIRTQDLDRTERLINCWREPYLLQAACRRWSEEEAELTRPVLEEAAQMYTQVIFVTHFPCFTAACWDEEGRPDVEENGWWPWSINTTLGRVILDIIERYPQVHFTLLTGHTHGGGRKNLRSNLTCISGRATYGHPRLAETFIL